MHNLQGKSIAILGLGASGEFAARLAQQQGGEVYVSEAQKSAATTARGVALSRLGIAVDVGHHDLERIATAGCVVASPGIPPDADILQALRARGIGWVSEPEFAFRFLRSPLIGITGTNGKTTVAALIDHLIAGDARTVALGGNIGAGLGPPASGTVMGEPPDWTVWELSSYQLGATEQLRVDVGVITNLAPDHLDRYASLEDYYADKAHIFDHASDDSVWVLRAQAEIDALAEGVAGRHYRFAIEPGPDVSAYMADGMLTLDYKGQPEPLVPFAETRLLGRHNIENALSATLAAHVAGVGREALQDGLRTFQPLPHRLEAIAELDGVLWVNDSKATNVAATASALTSLDRPLVVLLGGVDKGEDFGPLRTSLQLRARCAILFGEVRERLARELQGSAPVHVVPGTFSAVVEAARQHARPGDGVLLSPATASFDMFRNYEERGNAFRRLIEEM